MGKAEQQDWKRKLTRWRWSLSARRDIGRIPHSARSSPDVGEATEIDGEDARDVTTQYDLKAIRHLKRRKPPETAEKKESTNMNELLTVSEVADILRVDDTTVRRWVKTGALEAVVLPHVNERCAYRIRLRDMEKILGMPAASIIMEPDMSEQAL